MNCTHHLFAIWGLILNALGSAGWFFIPISRQYFADGGWQPPGAFFSELAPPGMEREYRGRHVRQKWLFRISAAALFVGFGLQLIDLLVT